MTLDHVRQLLPPGRDIYSRYRGYGTIEGAGQLARGFVVYVRWEERKRREAGGYAEWREAVTLSTALGWRTA